MEQEKIRLAADWLRSLLHLEILAPIEKFELTEMGQNQYRLTFEINGAEKVFPMPAAWVEGIADGNELIRELIKGNLLNLARMV